MKRSITGGYRTKVILEYPSGSSIVDGVEETHYATGAEIYAAIDVKPPKGRQVQVAEADHATSTRWFCIRYIDGITSKWRARIGTKTFNVVSPPLDEGMRHRELFLELEAVE